MIRREENVRKLLLIAGGVINLLMGVFHFWFWDMYNWREELPRLNIYNRGILQTLNIAAIYILLGMALVGFKLAFRGIKTWADKAFLLGMAGFYIVRSGAQIAFFDHSNPSLGLAGFCLVIAGVFFLPLMLKTK
jgi:hypothetical protein